MNGKIPFFEENNNESDVEVHHWGDKKRKIARTLEDFENNNNSKEMKLEIEQIKTDEKEKDEVLDKSLKGKDVLKEINEEENKQMKENDLTKRSKKVNSKIKI